MPFDKNEISTSCWGRRGAGKIAGACIRDKSGNERVHRRGNRKRSSGGAKKKKGRGTKRGSAFFLRVYVAVVLPVVDPVPDVSEDRPFLLQPLLSLALLLLFASCAAEAADTSFAKPSFPPLRSPRRKPPWITDPFHFKGISSIFFLPVSVLRWFSILGLDKMIGTLINRFENIGKEMKIVF